MTLIQKSYSQMSTNSNSNSNSNSNALQEIKAVCDDDETFDIENDPFIETPWEIIRSYFGNQYLECLVRHQIESYNNFINHQIFKTIEMFNPINIKTEDDYNSTVDKYALELFINF